MIMKCKMMKFGIVLALGLAVSAYAADACNDEMGHVGEGKKVNGTGSESAKGDVGNSGFQYELWHSEGSGSLTYYDNGTFSAEWNDSRDFIARVGLAYAESKNFDEFGDFSADFKFTKSGSADFSYFGVYGWTENPRAEYFILEDWFSAPNPEYLGEKKGEITVDGDTYDIYIFQDNKLYVQGNINYPTFYSVRRTPRQCGHIDITAHFKKWKELGLNLGKMNVITMIAEAGNVASGATDFTGSSGKVDFTYFNVTESKSTSPALSSSSAAPESSATAPESSSAAPESPAAGSSSSVVSPDSGSTAPANHAEPAEPSSSDAFVESSDGKKGTDALPVEVRAFDKPGTYQVFDMQGRVLGSVSVPAGMSVNGAIFAKFGKSGIYLVQYEGALKVLSVTK